MKKIHIAFLLFCFTNSYSHSIEPDVFVQSTVNRASEILSKDISKDEKVSDGDFVALRPEKGMSASKINDIIGKKAKRDLKKYESISISDFI